MTIYDLNLRKILLNRSDHMPLQVSFESRIFPKEIGISNQPPSNSGK